MGQYYDVKQVESVGRRVSHYPMEKYPGGKFQHRLVAVCDRLIFKLAADVTRPEEYANFYSQYAQGLLVTFDLYDFKPDEHLAEDREIRQ